ncbi:MAG TPA: CopD family protein [Ignavibacteriaceae bacterium]|nr:CopD family protein [Ignavibacteriaceae bacterium]
MADQTINFFHLLGTSVWIGGMIYTHFILLPSVSKIDPGESGKLQGIAAKRFSIIAWVAIIILIITGFLKTPGEMLLNISTQFGIVLFIKHIFILGVVLVGIVIGGIVVPGLRKNMPNPGEKPREKFLLFKKRLELLATTNLILGILILICASMLW